MGRCDGNVEEFCGRVTALRVVPYLSDAKETPILGNETLSLTRVTPPHEFIILQVS